MLELVVSSSLSKGLCNPAACSPQSPSRQACCPAVVLHQWQGLQLAERACGSAGEELRAALEEWQDRRLTTADAPSRLSTGFLDGNNPIVDIYELKVSCSLPGGTTDVVLLGWEAPAKPNLWQW